MRVHRLQWAACVSFVVAACGNGMDNGPWSSRQSVEATDQDDEGEAQDLAGDSEPRDIAGNGETGRSADTGRTGVSPRSPEEGSADIVPMDPGPVLDLAISGHAVATPAEYGLTDEGMKNAALNYAPILYLHPEEVFFPDGIDNYLRYVNLVCNDELISNSLTPDNFPFVANYPNCFLTTKTPLPGPDSMLDIFSGHNPANSPVPVYVHLYIPDGKTDGTFDAEYMFFFPYNFGKNICPSIAWPANNCWATGGRVRMGNHVGDWEHITIRFDRTGTPTSFYVSWHDSGEVKYPNDVMRPYGNWASVPTFFVANGSHGIHASEGRFNYKYIGTGDENFADETAQGSPWETWQNLVFVTGGEPWTSWNYKGRWGNPHAGKNICGLKPLVPQAVCDWLQLPDDEYELNDGPGGMDLAPDAKRLP